MGKSLANQKVVLAYPHGHEMSARFVKSQYLMTVYDAKNNRRLIDGGYLANSSGANITNARNEIVSSFLNLDYDWLCFIDTDMVFEPDTVDRLVKAAHPEKRPIVGGLCFSLKDGTHCVPTIYMLRPQDGKIGRVFNYPRDQIFDRIDGQPIMTGTGCVLIHRSVFEKMRDSEKFPKAYPWFQETNIGGLPVGEDLTFMVRAMSLGIPVNVDTSIRVGHEKPFVLTEEMFLAQQAAAQQAELPTFVIVPFKDRHDLTEQLISSLDGYAQLFLYDHGSEEPPPASWGATDARGWNFHRMWNDGIERALAVTGGRCNIAILNNDIKVGPGFIAGLEQGLRCSDSLVAVSPNYDGRDFSGDVLPVRGICAGRYDGTGGMAGFAFMVKGEWFEQTGWRFPEEYQLFFGDTDLAFSIESSGGIIGIVRTVACEHINGGGQTKRPGDESIIMKRDQEVFKKRWNAVDA